MGENKSIAAVQVRGGGVLGSSESVIWLLKSLDKNTSLALAAACTAILQDSQKATAY